MPSFCNNSIKRNLYSVIFVMCTNFYFFFYLLLFLCFVNFLCTQNICSLKKKNCQKKKNWKLYIRDIGASTYYTSFSTPFLPPFFLVSPVKRNYHPVTWPPPHTESTLIILKIILGGAGSFLSFFCLGYVAKLSS